MTNLTKMLAACVCVSAIAVTAAAIPSANKESASWMIISEAYETFDPDPDPDPDPTPAQSEEPETTTTASIETPPPTATPSPQPTSIPASKPTVPSKAEYSFGSGDNADWSDISSDIRNRNSGEIKVNMNGNTSVPMNIFTNIKGRDVDLVLDMGNGITWTINGEDVKDPKDVDLGFKKGENFIPIEIINNVTGEKETIQLSLNYDGEFGFEAIMTIPLGSNNNGLYANLFYYNSVTKELELVDYSEIKNGNADLKFTHASDWAIIIDSEPLTMDAGADAGISDDSADVETRSMAASFVFPFAAVAAAAGYVLIARKKTDK